MAPVNTADGQDKAISKTKKPVTHPKYAEMVQSAIGSMKERGGSSRQAILKHIRTSFEVCPDEKIVNQHLKVALRAGVKNGHLKQAKGSGASGSFRLGEAAKLDKPKTKVVKPKVEKKTKLTAVKKPKSPKKAVSKPKVVPKVKKDSIKQPKQASAKAADRPNKPKGNKSKNVKGKSADKIKSAAKKSIKKGKKTAAKADKPVSKKLF